MDFHLATHKHNQFGEKPGAVKDCEFFLKCKCFKGDDIALERHIEESQKDHLLLVRNYLSCKSHQITGVEDLLATLQASSDPSNKRNKPPPQEIEGQKVKLTWAIALGDEATVLTIIRDKFIGPNAEISKIWKRCYFYVNSALRNSQLKQTWDIWAAITKWTSTFHTSSILLVSTTLCVQLEGHDKVVEVFACHLTAEQLNYPTNNGDTPLHIAALRGHFNCVKTLMSKGADATSTLINKNDRTAAQLAEQNQ